MNNLEQKTVYLCSGFLFIIVIVIGECKEYVDLACSFTSQHIGARIVRGENASSGMFPHQVFLYSISRVKDIQSLICGGSLISERFILTAAHCIQDFKSFELQVGIGGIYLEEMNVRLEINSSQVHIHPEYTGTPFIGDLALIELEKNLEFSSDVRPICLNTKLEDYYDSMIATGWGHDETGIMSLYLKMVEFRRSKESDKYCREIVKSSNPGPDFNERGICLAHTKGINYGDSGGPLQVKLPNKCNNTDNIWEQIGINSAVDLTRSYNSGMMLAQLFVKIEYFVPWIANIVWPDEP